MTIRIVTDSVCDIPQETAEAHNITVIPAYVNIGNESYLDGIDLTHQEFYELLPYLNEVPTTAAPAPGEFTAIYNKLAAQGASQILSIHLASSLSGMLNAARLGAEATDAVSVRLFDSQQITLGQGLLVMAAAELVSSGHTMEKILSHLNDMVRRTYVFGLLDTLEYLRKGGRVNWASYGIGTLLRIKPLLEVHMGEVKMREKVRTSSRALIRFISLANELAPFERLALLHTHAKEERIEAAIAGIRDLIPGGQQPMIVELTPALGTHLGPNGLGIACITKGKHT